LFTDIYLAGKRPARAIEGGAGKRPARAIGGGAGKRPARAMGGEKRGSRDSG